jgi:putative transposase
MKHRHSPEQIVKFLREAEAQIAAGKTVLEVCREKGISDMTYYNWRKSYGHMKVDHVKKLVADLSLDKAILKEALEGKY